MFFLSTTSVFGLRLWLGRAPVLAWPPTWLGCWRRAVHDCIAVLIFANGVLPDLETARRPAAEPDT